MTEWSLWKNLFCTTMEQLSSTREGSKQKRKHVRAVQTPAQRLLATGQIDALQREWIETRRISNNPFEMKARIEVLLAQVWQQRKALLLAEEEESLGSGGRPALLLMQSLRYVPVQPQKQPKPSANQPEPKKLRCPNYEAMEARSELGFGVLQL